MAPASRNKTGTKAVTTSPNTRLTFGRVTKSQRTVLSAKPSPKKALALANVVEEKRPKEEKVQPTLQAESLPRQDQKQQPQPEPTLPTDRNQRPNKRSAEDAELSEQTISCIQRSIRGKRVKFQLATPPPSSPEPDTLAAGLPEAYLQLEGLHDAFLRSLALHYAHHAIHASVDLNALLPSITRLWKKRNVLQKDVQRMLAVYEISPDYLTSPSRVQLTLESKPETQSVKHSKGPFQLTVIGVGANTRTVIEYVRTPTKSSGSPERLDQFDKQRIQERYRHALGALFRRPSPLVSVSSTTTISVDDLPLLTCSIGSQTASRQTKIATTRNEILQLATDAQSRSQSQLDLGNLSLSDPLEQRPAAVKARTLSLFDRVRAKQVASASASGSAPSADSVLRRRAISRISDVVDVLRMKQAQKLNSQFRLQAYDVEAGPGKSLQARLKVSFSFDALVAEIQQSVGVPIPVEEVRMCIQILGRDLSDSWCSLYDMGGVKGVTLQGEGKSGMEMKRTCESIMR